MTPETCNSPDSNSPKQGSNGDQAVNVALAPCPFCGSANIKLRTSKSEMSWVACVACGLDAPTETGQTEAEAVAYWNRRAAPALPQDVAAVTNQLREAHRNKGVPTDERTCIDAYALILFQSSTIASAREVIEPFAKASDRVVELDAVRARHSLPPLDTILIDAEPLRAARDWEGR